MLRLQNQEGVGGQKAIRKDHDLTAGGRLLDPAKVVKVEPPTIQLQLGSTSPVALI